MNTKQKEILEKRVVKIKKEIKTNKIVAMVLFILGIFTIIFGGWILIIIGFLCVKKYNNLKKELQELEFKLAE
jgi:uncharacterized membrane protein